MVPGRGRCWGGPERVDAVNRPGDGTRGASAGGLALAVPVIPLPRALGLAEGNGRNCGGVHRDVLLWDSQRGGCGLG